ncbi:MAG: hypothetical protein P9X24_00040 [Candidatus Hatepunaea meridiana]|nr:hypothetical protein [Candidatus Hatepunaea meridiana]
MLEAKISVRSEVTLPKEILEYMRVQPGDRIKFRVRKDGAVVIEQKIDIRSLKGMVDTGDIHLSVEEMNEVIEKEAGKL